jgi:hypothetical protein
LQNLQWQEAGDTLQGSTSNSSAMPGGHEDLTDKLRKSGF